MADEELGTGSVTITLDSDAAEGEAERLGDSIQRILDRASRRAGQRITRNLTRAIRSVSPLTVQVDANTARVDAALRAVGGASVQIPVNPDVDRIAFAQAAQAALSGVAVSIRVVPDMSGFDALVRAHRVPDVTVGVNIDTDRFTRALGGLGRVAARAGRAVTGALGLGAVGIAAASAAQGVVALTVALAPAAGAIAALPAVALGAAAANAALKLSLVGVSDALKAAASGDAEKLADALEKLSPSAREAVSAFAALQPRLRAVQQSVQEAFFTRFSDQVEGAFKNLLPLQSALGGISAQFGRAASEALKFAASKDALTPLRGILAGTHAALSGLAPATQPVLKGFLDVAAAVSTAFGQQLGAGIRDAGQRMGEFLSVFAASGRAVEAVRAAGQVFRQLGEIASNVGGIISGVFDVANDVGGGLLNNLAQITAGVEAFVESASGKTAIANVFGTLSAVAAQLAPILGAVIQTAGVIAPTITRAIETIGPIIENLITQLGVGLQGALPDLQVAFANVAGALETLAPSLPGIVEALASLARSASDLLVPLAPVVSLLLQAVAPVVEFAAPLLVAAGAMAAFSAAAGVITGVLGTLGAAWVALNVAFVASPLGVIAAAVAALGVAVYLLYQRFEPVRNVVDAVGSALKSAFEGVVGFVTDVTSAVVGFATALPGFFASLPATIGGFFTNLGTTILNFFTSLPGTILGLMQSLGATLLTALTTAGTSILTFFVNLPAQIGNALLTVGEVLVTSFVQGVAFLLGALAGLSVRIVTFFINLPQQIYNGLLSLGALLVNAFTSAFTTATGAITSFISSAVSFFTALPGRIVAAVTALPGLLLGIFNRAKTAVLGAVSSLVSSAVSFLSSLPGRAAGAVSAIVGTLRGVFNSAKNAVVSTVTGLVSNVIGRVRELPGKAASALSGIGSTLVSAGQDLVRGFINGIGSLAGQVADAVSSLIDKAKDSFTDGLKIFSPSRVTRGYGINVGQGFINGMISTREAIGRTADTLVKQVRDAFKGQNTRLDDVLVKQIRSGQKQLEALAGQRERIAARIKAANEFAAQTTQSALQSFSLQNLFGTGDGRASTATGLADSIGQATAKIRTFNNQINALAKRGLRRDLLSQLIGLGPDQGAGLARTLSSATGAQLADLNEAQKQLDAASKRLGRDSADALFDAGSQASKGFLAGLKAQQKDIQDLMLTLARAMAKSLRRALGIKSPSRIMMRIGAQTMDGLSLGVDRRLSSVARSAVRAASALTEPFGPGVPAPSFAGAGAGGVGRFGGGFGGVDNSRSSSRTVNSPVTVNLNGTGYTDADAQRVVNRVVALASGL